jgi:hypothetical protein
MDREQKQIRNETDLQRCRKMGWLMVMSLRLRAAPMQDVLGDGLQAFCLTTVKAI